MSSLTAANFSCAGMVRRFSCLAWSRKAAFFGVLGLLLAGFVWPAWATTYNYTGGNYTSTSPFTGPCGAGTCANYTTGMSVTGSFTTAAPLAANLGSVDIAAQVTSFSFSDGINTYASANPGSWIISFEASTDGSGVPSGGMFIVLGTWITGSNPHTTADRYAQFEIDFSVDGTNNLACSTVGTTNGNPDTCISNPGSDTNSSSFTGPSGVWAIGGGPGTTTVNLVSSQNPSAIGQSVTFTATVNGSSPTGTVQFKDGAGNLGSAVTLSGTVAALSTSTLGVGTHPITAVYSGDANNAGSTSPPVDQLVSNGASVSTTIPTLSEWALVLLIGLVFAMAAIALRGRYRR